MANIGPISNINISSGQPYLCLWWPRLRLLMVTFLIQSKLHHSLLQELLAVLCLADRCNHVGKRQVRHLVLASYRAKLLVRRCSALGLVVMTKLGSGKDANCFRGVCCWLNVQGHSLVLHFNIKFNIKFSQPSVFSLCHACLYWMPKTNFHCGH